MKPLARLIYIMMAKAGFRNCTTLAKAAGVHVLTLYRVLGGKQNPNIITLGKLATALHCHVSDFFADAESEAK